MSTSLAPAALGKLQALITDRLGLQGLSAEAVEAVVASRMRANAQREPEAYGRLLETEAAARTEWRALAAALTVGETYFFRAPDQFHAFAEVALPQRLAARRGDRRLRIVSAGCASGEEAYTLAMVAAQAPAPLWNVAIEGVDVNVALLELARQGRYSAWSLRATPAPLQAQHFEREGAGFRVAAPIREMVRFDERNLLADDPFWEPGSLDVVFFRNVSIYFSPEATRRAIARFAEALAPGGYLFLGPAESLRGVSTDFELRQSHGAFYYQRAAQAPARNVSVGDSLTRRVPKAAAPIAPAGGPRRPSPARSLDRVRQLFQQERFAEALALLADTPTGGSARRAALLLNGAILTHMGRGPEAEAACREALALDAGCAEAHLLLSLCREADGDEAGAMRHCDAARRLDPLFAMPHFHHGMRARRQGDPAAARRAFRQALGLLAREEAERLLLFGGGFGKATLEALCESELRRCEGMR